MRIEHVEEIGSTNAELLLRPFAVEAGEPVLLVARHQSAGRGRRGRQWASRAGSSLTCSLALERVLRPGQTPLSGLSLAAGVTVAEVLARLGVPVRLKWPNDLMRNAAKLGGILVEARRAAAIERAVIGVGLNLASDPLVAADAAQPIATLFEQPPDETVRLGLAEALGRSLAAAFERFDAQGLAAFADRWRALDMLDGRAVTVIEADGRCWHGEAGGIDADGRLLVYVDGRQHAVVAGEVSVRALSLP
ncbi:MAG: biotin--[acetyl-CoA-carboxylase] ligase [Burkholderiales bacterium]|nr:MAG: biotin--[acetyl-CoA-carboxylase] ligase [Burkholderiales bacterium]